MIGVLFVLGLIALALIAFGFGIAWEKWRAETHPQRGVALGAEMGVTELVTENDPMTDAFHMRLTISRKDMVSLSAHNWERFSEDMTAFWQVLGGTDLRMVPPAPVLSQKVREDQARRVEA